MPSLPEEVETIRLAGRTEGLLLDPVYTGKAMTGMLSTIRGGDLARGGARIHSHRRGLRLMARRDLFAALIGPRAPTMAATGKHTAATPCCRGHDNERRRRVRK